MKNLINKMVRSRFSLIYLVLFIGALYMLQEKAIMPVVMAVVKSDLFFEKPVEENEPLGKIEGKTSRSNFAMRQCENAVKQQDALAKQAQFSDDSYEAWALGNRQYLIRSSVKISDAEKGSVTKLYACTVKLNNDQEDKPENWTTLAVDFNPAP